MKLVIMSVFISLGALSAQAQVAPIQLDSPMNFTLPAMDVRITSDNKVAIRLDEAVLIYPEKTNSFHTPVADLYAKIEHIGTLVGMKGMNSIVIYFEPSDCIVHSTDKDVFACSANTPRKVDGAEVEFSGQMLALSPQSITTPTVSVRLKKVTTVEAPDFETTSYTVNVRVVLADQQKDLTIHAEKRELQIHHQIL